MKCISKDRNSAPCRYKADGTNGKFCKNHTYMNEYTESMLANIKSCSTRKKMYYMEEYNTCSSCRTRGEKTRIESKDSIILCVKDGCKYKKSINKYCGKHQALMFVEETELLGLKTCVNYIRGCKTQNPTSYKFSRCEVCLAKDREKDHKKRGTINTNIIVEGLKQCSTCCSMHPLDSFKGLHGETKCCIDCREANKRADLKRDSEHVKELARKNSMKPERKEAKILWKETNYGKVAGYWMEARNKLIDSDLEGYLKRNALQAQKWRDVNPEKVKEINIKKINSIDNQYYVYNVSANSKNLTFELTKDDFIIMVKLPCNYCGIIQEKGFNGVDRLDSSKGYITENCVSCCEMCNMMKGCLGPTIFVNRVEHILTHLKIVEGNLHPEDFKAYTNISFVKYKSRAKGRELEFTLTKELFDKTTNEDCYLCGKSPNIIHKNGLDRFDSSVGYIETNIKSCCGNCNFLKRNHNYDVFIDKCNLIYKKLDRPKIKRAITKEKIKVVEPDVLIINYLNVLKTPVNIEENNNIVKSNKKTSEEKTEIAKIKKQKQRAELRERYGDEKYKKMRAEEIASTRRNIKLNEV